MRGAGEDKRKDPVHALLDHIGTPTAAQAEAPNDASIAPSTVAAYQTPTFYVEAAAVSTLFGTALDPRIPLERQDVRAALTPGGAQVRLFAYPHLSGMRATAFAVGRMTVDIEVLGQRLAKELSI